MVDHSPLAHAITRFTGGDGIFETAIPRLMLIRKSDRGEPVHALHQPAMCIIAQGEKQVILGERIYAYGSGRYLVASMEVPVVGTITKASADEPYLCFCLILDPATISDLLLEGIPEKWEPAPLRETREATALAPSTEEAASALSTHSLTQPLLDAATRLVSLLETASDVPVLAPLVEREILYRLLTGPYGPRMRDVATPDSRLAQIGRVIGWLRQNFREPFNANDLARQAGMSASSFHHHFRQLTAMSPLQFQKQLRLQEARRLMLAERLDAAEAGHQVGYDSPSQFSREYRRLFGAPPLRDMGRFRAAPELLDPS